MPDKWIYFSPHFDDAALSVGGLIWEQVQQGNRVEIWTICGGKPETNLPLSSFAKSLHAKWKAEISPIQNRADEDALACQQLGAGYRHLSWPDCIYRINPHTNEPIVQVEEDLFKPFGDEEKNELSGILSSIDIPKNAQIVVPFGIGNHRDHTVVRAVAEEQFGEVWHYPDYPYIVQNQIKIADIVPPSSIAFKKTLSGKSLQVWKDAIGCYRTQLPVFWKNLHEMNVAINEYAYKIHIQHSDTILWKF